MSYARKLFAASAVLSLCIAAPAFAKIETGSTVSDMTVTDSNGAVHNLSDFAGKKLILEWTNADCPYVKKHYTTDNMQKTQRLATADGDTVWLSIISSAPGKQGFVDGAKANQLTEIRAAAPTAVILDSEGTAGRAFAAKTTPHMFILDESQTLVYQGAIDDNRSANPADVAGAKNYVLATLEDLEAGRTVVDAETSPYGCSVKYGL